MKTTRSKIFTCIALLIGSLYSTSTAKSSPMANMVPPTYSTGIYFFPDTSSWHPSEFEWTSGEPTAPGATRGSNFANGKLVVWVQSERFNIGTTQYTGSGKISYDRQGPLNTLSTNVSGLVSGVAPSLNTTASSGVATFNDNDEEILGPGNVSESVDGIDSYDKTAQNLLLVVTNISPLINEFTCNVNFRLYAIAIKR